MTAPIGTKTKRTKGPDVYPPKEIRENTKARRAWVDAKVAELNASGTVEARSVGIGSYQRVSVWHVTQVQGRVRLRGVCQCCGGAQVVQDGRMVLHGYQRPGYGTVYGECPGRGEAPLNAQKTLTEAWLAEAETDLVARQAELEAAEQAERAASSAMYADDRYDRERGAYQAMPKSPRHRTGQEPKPEDVQAWRAGMKAWRETYPLTAELVRAKEAHTAARHAEWTQRGLRDHFATLLASGVHGTPLTEEVVA